MSTPKRAIIFDGQNMSTDDLNFSEEKRVEEDDLRFKEIASTYGILAGVLDSLALSNPAPYTGNVAAGVAYDDLGQTIRVVTGDTNPLRAAPLEFTFAGGDVGKLVTLAYATEATTPFDHPVTGTPGFTRLDYNPTVHLRVTAALHEVVIGTIETIDGSGNAAFNTDDAQYWGALLAPQTEQNISDALTGVYRHQDQDHVSGIEHVGPSSNPGAVTISSGPNPDEANVQDTASKDSLLVYNKRIDGAGKFTEKNIKFTGVEVTAEAQLWAIYVDIEGVCGKLLLAQHDDLTNIPGMQIVDLAPFGVAYPNPLIIEHYKPSGTHYIRIAGSSTVSPTTNGLYLLRLDDNPSLGVLIYVTVGTLPSGGSSGAPHVDNITVSDLTGNAYISESVPVTVNDGISGGLWLANVWWSGTALGLLGYGTWATTGVAYDKRSYGNLDEGKLSDAFATRLDRMIGETRTNGFVAAPRLVTSSVGLNAFLYRSDVVVGTTGEVNPAADPKEAYAYFGGKRVAVPLKASFSIPVNSSRCIYLQDNGNGTSTWGVQSGQGLIGVELSSGRMPVWNVRTDGTGTIDVQDLTVVLPSIDREAVRLGRKNVGVLELGAAYDDDEAALLPRLRVALPIESTAARSAVMAAEIAVANYDPADVALFYKLGLGLGWTVYANNTGDGRATHEVVLNAYWDKSDDMWHRRTTGLVSAILSLDQGILRWFSRNSGPPHEWTHTFDEDGWDNLIISASTSEVLTIGRVWANFESGTFLTQGRHRRCTVDRNITDQTFTLTFDTEMVSANYAVSALAWEWSGIGTGKSYKVVPTDKTDSLLTFFLLDSDDNVVDIDRAAIVKLDVILQA